MKTTNKYALTLAMAMSLAGGISGKAFAQARGGEKRTEFQEDLQEFYKSERSFLGATPSHNLTPRRDNIGFSLGVMPVDIAMTPLTTDTSSKRTTLDMTGYTAVPTVAFFGSTFGVGISAEVGSRSIKFLQEIDATAAESEYFFEQFSETSYLGAGLYGYVLVPKSVMPRFMNATIIVGGRNLTATHKTRGTRTDPTASPEPLTMKYDVRVFDAGLNFSLTLARRFQIIPWVNHRTTSLGVPKDKDEKAAASGFPQETVDAVKLDRDLIWRTTPETTYGVDLGIQFTNVNVHIGGLLGYLVNTSSESNRLQDKSLTVALSYYLAPPKE